MIRREHPPNFDAIVAAFPIAGRGSVIFAYGEDIFNPSNISIPKWLAAHEYKHCARQAVTSPEAWWKSYLNDSEFRYQEELLGHVEEFKKGVKGYSRAGLLNRTAERLIAPLYNYWPPRTFKQAIADIQSVLRP